MASKHSTSRSWPGAGSVISSFVVSIAVVASLSACGNDGLVPDVTVDDTDNQTPNTDTRTVDPPTVSNLPITQP